REPRERDVVFEREHRCGPAAGGGGSEPIPRALTGDWGAVGVLIARGPLARGGPPGASRLLGGALLGGATRPMPAPPGGRRRPVLACPPTQRAGRRDRRSARGDRLRRGRSRAHMRPSPARRTRRGASSARPGGGARRGAGTGRP